MGKQMKQDMTPTLTPKNVDNNSFLGIHNMMLQISYYQVIMFEY